MMNTMYANAKRRAPIYLLRGRCLCPRDRGRVMKSLWIAEVWNGLRQWWTIILIC